MTTTGRMEIFVSRLLGGGFEIDVDGDVTVLRTKAEANALVDSAIRVAQELDMLWSISGMDKLK